VADAKIGWEDFREDQKSWWRVAGTIKRSDLEKLVRDYKGSSVSRDFFEAWRRKRKRAKR